MARYVDPGLRIVVWHDAAGGYDNGHELHVVFYRNRSTATKVMQRLAKRGWKMAEFADPTGPKYKHFDYYGDDQG